MTSETPVKIIIEEAHVHSEGASGIEQKQLNDGITIEGLKELSKVYDNLDSTEREQLGELCKSFEEKNPTDVQKIKELFEIVELEKIKEFSKTIGDFRPDPEHIKKFEDFFKRVEGNHPVEFGRFKEASVGSKELENKGSNITTAVINKFKELSTIPRPSRQLDAVRQWITEWSEKNDSIWHRDGSGFIWRKDGYGNMVVVIGDPLTKNTPIILQSHMDMVATKTEDSKHNFNTDPIEVIIEGNIMRANKTTLGADNGISLVSSMLLAEDLAKNHEKFLENNCVYLLMTSDEEIGCGGAENLEMYPFLPEKAYVINIDSEVNGEVCCGSAGGSDCHITFPSKRYYCTTKDYEAASLKFYSLKGGHSGLDIGKGQISAIKMLVNFFNRLKSMNIGIKLVSISGGNAHNAIPICAEMNFLIKKDSLTEEIIVEYINEIKRRYDEQNIKYDFHKIPLPKTSRKVGYISNRVMDILTILHQGITDMNPYNNACVESSTNIGIVKTIEAKSENGFVDKDEQVIVDINILSRSFDVAALKEQHYKLKVIAKMFKAKITDFTHYDGWSPDLSRDYILSVLKKTHRELFSKECEIKKVHAGLETSTLLVRYPKWECMSIGPSIHKAHTYEEYCEVDTIEPFYKWLRLCVLELNRTKSLGEI